MPDQIEKLFLELRRIQREIVCLLQEENLAEGTEPPSEAFGWTETKLRTWFENFGNDVLGGQPGGGRLIENTAVNSEPLAGAGEEIRHLVDQPGVSSRQYRESCIKAGIPALPHGLFPPGDATLKALVEDGYQPFMKGLTHECANGGYRFAPVQGWATGNISAGNGLDMRLFINPARTMEIQGALRFGARTHGGQTGTGFFVHGGAIETALDEATAECCKAWCHPMAVTAAFEIRIAKGPQSMRTYLVQCKVTKDIIAGVKEEVVGKIFDPADLQNPLAVAKATLANSAKLPGVLESFESKPKQ